MRNSGSWRRFPRAGDQSANNGLLKPLPRSYAPETLLEAAAALSILLEAPDADAIFEEIKPNLLDTER